MPLHTQRFVKRPVEIEAVQWFQNGDHPLDHVGEIVTDPLGGPDYARIEGALVRFFRHPDYPGDQVHDRCGRTWHDHGWIDTLEGGHTVCPCDWIITGVQGEHYPCKPDIFAATYLSASKIGELSDGFHTFNELYKFRMAYNAALFNEWAKGGLYGVHKSWRHDDGQRCFDGGWFIVMADLPSGQISNHYQARYWDLFQIPEKPRASFFDGHTAQDVYDRLVTSLVALSAAPTQEQLLARTEVPGQLSLFE
jgi:hypothetical protein